jgi:hypothetical protein
VTIQPGLNLPLVEFLQPPASPGGILMLPELPLNRYISDGFAFCDHHHTAWDGLQRAESPLDLVICHDPKQKIQNIVNLFLTGPKTETIYAIAN